MQVTYGIELTEPDDEYFQMVEGIAAVGESISVPGKFPVEALPSLQYLPAWFPGGGFKTFSEDAKVYLHDCLNKLYETATDGLVR